MGELEQEYGNRVEFTVVSPEETAAASADIEAFGFTALKHGLALYGTLYGSRRAPSLRRGLPLFLAPPLSITVDQVDDLIDRLDATLTEWEDALGI